MSPKKGLGLMHVITGPGKGKTTAAFGLAMRASGHGLKVCIIQFMKTGGTSGEVMAAKRLKGVKVEQFGTGRFVDPKSPCEEDRKCAREALERARQKLSNRECDLLVLDEISTAASIGLVGPSEVLDILSSRGDGVEVVLTGRNAPMEFVEAADYVSIIESKKHPLEAGVQAREGIEW